MTAVILGTGSRTYDRPDLVRLVLRAVAGRYHGDVVLRYGAAKRGADRFMANCWTRMGLPLEAYPADWDGPCQPDCDHGPRRTHHGDAADTYCPAAGPRRNRAMIDAGDVTEVHGFPKGRASGTLGTLQYALEAGLPVHTWWADRPEQILRYAEISPSVADSRGPYGISPWLLDPS